MLNLLLVGGARSHHCLLDLARAVFMHPQAGIDRSHNRGAARLPELERRVWITRHENLLDTDDIRAILLNQFGEVMEDFLQPLGKSALAHPNTPRGDVLLAARFMAHNAKTGNAGAGVDTQYQRHIIPISVRVIEKREACASLLLLSRHWVNPTAP